VLASVSGNLRGVVRVTGNFTSQSPLHPAAKALLTEAFSQGWADPKKIGDSSARTAILRNEAIESLANNLGVSPTEIEIIGEPRLGQHLAISGLLDPQTALIHSAIDRKSVFAVGNAHQANGGKSEVLSVDTTGNILISKRSAGSTVLALQGANIETGITQQVNRVISELDPTYVALDYSAAANLEFPARWDSAILDASTWQGPAGIGILLIRNSTKWKNPLPNLGLRRTPESSSLPLLLASAVALDAWLVDQKKEAKVLAGLNLRLRSELAAAIPGIVFAGTFDNSLAHILGLSIPDCVGEDLVRQLNELGFVLDSGSACTAEQMQPSHVFAALKINDAGNLRITLHHGVTEEEITDLINAITLVVQRSR
jgi:cysteine desulfurase